MINDITLRFFTCTAYDGELIEANEREFQEFEGVITYDRNTVFANGVSQILLIKEGE